MEACLEIEAPALEQEETIEIEVQPKPEPKQRTRGELLAEINAAQSKLRREFDPAQEEDDRVKLLMRYPRLAAHLICVSLGYLCPRSAAVAIYKYKNGLPFYCEWFDHMATCRMRGKGENPNVWQNREGYEAEMVQVGKEVMREAFTRRHSHRGMMAEYLQGRIVVLRELNGHGPEFASWF